MLLRWLLWIVRAGAVAATAVMYWSEDSHPTAKTTIVLLAVSATTCQLVRFLIPSASKKAMNTAANFPIVRKVAVIGAGPSGLVSAKVLIEAGMEVTVFEQQQRVGGAFRYRAYDGAEQVSSKFITSFSDFRFGAEVDDHVTLPAYCRYLEKYCDRFNLWPMIRFQVTVEEVKRPPNGRYELQIRTGAREETLQFDAVLVCTGLHLHPYTPTIRDLCLFKGKQCHSAAYRGVGSPFRLRGKRVLVIGCGETGLDIAQQAADCGADSVTVSHRSGWLSVPKQLPNGVPLDIFITNVFESSREHRWMDRFRIKWKAATFFIRVGFFLGTGTSKGYGQWVGTKETVRRGWWFVNKQDGPMSRINRPYKRTLRQRLCRLLGATEVAPPDSANTAKLAVFADSEDATAESSGGAATIQGHAKPSPATVQHIRVVPQVTAVKQVGAAACTEPAVAVERTDGGVNSGGGRTAFHCVDGAHVEADIAIFATGYRQLFPFLPSRPRCVATSDHLLPPLRHVCSAQEPLLAFIGFARPNVGAIPPMSELQVYWWLHQCATKGAASSLGALSRPSYNLLGGCHKARTYGVDYGLYMETLAADIGATPSLMWLARHPAALVTYALGQCFIPFYRLRGPCAPKSPAARAELMRTCEGELYVAFKRRGWTGNLMFLVITLIFGALNLICWVVDCLLQAFGVYLW